MNIASTQIWVHFIKIPSEKVQKWIEVINILGRVGRAHPQENVV